MFPIERWGPAYPDPGALKQEIEVAAECFIESIQTHMGLEDIEQMYLKGSAFKRWDSPIDYVPVLSDIDLHVLFRGDRWRAHLSDLELSAAIASTTGQMLALRCPSPIHVPRLQMVAVNKLQESEDFIRSPATTVRVVTGEPYLADVPERERRRRAAVANISEAHELLGRLPDLVADRYSIHLRTVLRELSWRVSHAGPRVLDLLDVPFEEVWSGNRTKIVTLLDEAGEHEMARQYVSYYLAGWTYFLSADRDTDAGLGAVRSAAAVLKRSIVVADLAAQR
jgi:hypothetical protein